MAHSLPYLILTAHRDIFAFLDEIFTHIDGVFGPKNTFLRCNSISRKQIEMQPTPMMRQQILDVYNADAGRFRPLW